MESMESISTEEMTFLIEELIEKDGFLSSYRKDDKNLVSRLLKKLGKYKVTDSEFLISYGAISTIMNETRKELLMETVRGLVNSGLLDLGVSDKGELHGGIVGDKLLLEWTKK
jgi:hypothetical protein